MSTRQEGGGVRRRILTLELENKTGPSTTKIIECWRVWEKPDKIGAMTSNFTEGKKNYWTWFPIGRVISYSIEEVQEE